MIRWTIFFDKEQNMSIPISSVEDDNRLIDIMKMKPQGFVQFDDKTSKFWVNLDHVKCVVRDIAEDKPQEASSEEPAPFPPEKEA